MQEGERPSEQPQKLIEEFERVAAELQDLIQRINKTNASTVLDDGKTLADALAERDVLKIRQSMYRNLAQAANVTQNRYSRSEVRLESTVDIATLQEQAEDLAKAHRVLDTQVQSANWLTDLLE